MAFNRVLKESGTSKDQEPLLECPILKGMPTLHVIMWRSSLNTFLNRNIPKYVLFVCLDCLNILTLYGSANALFRKIICTATPVSILLGFPPLSAIFDLYLPFQISFSI